MNNEYYLEDVVDYMKDLESVKYDIINQIEKLDFIISDTEYKMSDIEIPSNPFLCFSKRNTDEYASKLSHYLSWKSLPLGLDKNNFSPPLQYRIFYSIEEETVRTSKDFTGEFIEELEGKTVIFNKPLLDCSTSKKIAIAPFVKPFLKSWHLSLKSISQEFSDVYFY